MVVLLTARNGKRWKDAAAAAEAILAYDWTSIVVHIVAWQAYDEQGDKPRGDANRREAVGLLRSILASGDGASPVTAMKVVTVAEEYAVLEATGKTRVRQALVRVGDHQYDVLDVTGRDVSISMLTRSEPEKMRQSGGRFPPRKPAGLNLRHPSRRHLLAELRQPNPAVPAAHSDEVGR